MAVSFLIYFIQDLVNFLLREVRCLGKRFCACFIKQFLLNLSSPRRSRRIKKIIEPVVNITHPLASIISPAQRVDEKKSAECTAQVGNMSARICSGNSGKIND